MNRPVLSPAQQRFKDMHVILSSFHADVGKICDTLSEAEALPLKAALQDLHSYFSRIAMPAFAVVEERRASQNGSSAAALNVPLPILISLHSTIPAFLALKIEEMAKEHERSARIRGACEEARKKLAAIALSAANERPRLGR